MEDLEGTRDSSEAAGLFLWDWNLEDPKLGLLDMALGRYVSSPQTVYLCRNEEKSGVIGLLLPDGESYTKRRSSTGTRFDCIDPWGISWEATIAWDGAKRAPVSKLPIGWKDEEETKPIYQESSKGLLLGRYGRNGDAWKDYRESGSGDSLRSTVVGFSVKTRIDDKVSRRFDEGRQSAS